MKTALLALWLLTLPAWAQPLSLTQAVERAQRQASLYGQNVLTEKIAGENITQAEAAFGPRLSFNPAVTYNTPSLSPIHPGLPSFSYLGQNAIFRNQALLTLAGEFDTSGRLEASLRRSEAALQEAAAGTEASRRTLVQVTEETYYGLSLAAARRQAAEQHLQRARDFERQTNLLLQAGEIARVELARTTIQTSQRTDELQQARAAEQVAEVALKTLVGWPATDPMEVEALEAPAQQSPPPQVERPELVALDAQKRGALEEVELARAELRPQVFYALDAGYISPNFDDTTFSRNFGLRAQVGVTFPLSDGGAAESRERQARYRAERAQMARTLFEQQFAQQYDNARIQVETAWLRIQTNRQNLKQAEEVETIAIARYHAGEARIVEVTDAQNVLVNQRFALLQAINDYLVGQSRLRWASGGTIP